MRVTLSISATCIRLMTVKGQRVHKWGSAPLEPGLVKEGRIQDTGAVAGVIKRLFSEVKASRRQAIVTVTGLPFIHRLLSLPELKPSLMGEAVLREVRREISLPLQELYLTWQIVARRESEQDFFVLGLAREPVDAVIRTLSQAGIKRCVLDLKPLALARAAHRGNVAIVSLGPDSFDIVLVANGVPVVMHSITPRGEGATIEDNIRRIADELSRTVRFHDNLHPGSAIGPDTPLLLTGELSTGVAVGELLQAETGYLVEPLASPLQFPPDLPVAEYVSNMGLALKGLLPKAVSRDGKTGYHDIDIDILSARRQVAASPLRWGHVVFLLVVMAGIGLLYPGYQVWSQADAGVVRLETELEGARQELHHTMLARAEMLELEDAINVLVDRKNVLIQEQEDILTAGGSVTDTLRIITGAMPAGVGIESIAVDSDRVVVSGVADTPASVVEYARALERTTAFIMVRIVEIGEVFDEEETGPVSTFFIIAVTR